MNEEPSEEIGVRKSQRFIFGPLTLTISLVSVCHRFSGFYHDSRLSQVLPHVRDLSQRSLPAIQAVPVVGLLAASGSSFCSGSSRLLNERLQSCG